jgi:hypothetical protein
MARPEWFALEVPAEVGVGAPMSIFRFRDKTLHVIGPFTGSLMLEVSVDGEHYGDFGNAISAPAFIRLELTASLLRVRVSKLTAGTPRVLFAGFDERAF